MPLLTSAYISLVIQFIVALIDLYGLTIPLYSKDNILKDILKLELFVQTIEFCFYIWLIFSINSKLNITKYRYWDWIITTPLMLISLTAFLNSSTYSSLYEFTLQNVDYLQKIILGNLLMLLLGYFGEILIIKNDIAIVLGFIPFIYIFSYIYMKDYNKIHDNSETYNKEIYWFFFVVWSLYGFAAILPFIYKNIMYNVLDLFSKNVFGLFLVFYIFSRRCDV